MRRVEPLSCVRQQSRHQPRMERVTLRAQLEVLEHAVERLALEVLHHEVVDALDLAEVEGAAHVDVVERRGDARLVEEHLHHHLVGGEVLVQQLDRDHLVHAAGAGRLREVDAPHATHRDAKTQLVAAQALRRRGEVTHGPSTLPRFGRFQASVSPRDLISSCRYTRSMPDARRF